MEPRSAPGQDGRHEGQAQGLEAEWRRGANRPPHAGEHGAQRSHPQGSDLHSEQDGKHGRVSTRKDTL